MSKDSKAAETKAAESRPIIVPEYFSSVGSYEDWIDQYESISETNHWNDEQKLMWLKVCLTGRALMVYKKFPITACSSYKKAKVAFQGRFEPESRRDLHLQTRQKGKT